MNTYLKMTGLALSAMLVLSGCGSSDSDSHDNHGAEIEGEKLFFFYNHMSQEQYAYHSDHGDYENLNSDPTSNFYMSDKESGRMIYWPHESTDANGTVSIDEKIVMVKADYDFAEDGNLTHENLIYLGHFHGEELAAHSPDEFDPESEKWASFSETIQQKKANALKALNLYLAEQNEIKEEIAEALSNESETLCNFFVPHHEEHEEEAPHYALTQDGELYVFKEGANGLEKYQGPLALDGASSCAMNESGITSAGEHGVFVYMYSSKTLYLVDEHGADYHEHSKWGINELLPSSVEPTQMIGFGGESDHEGHDH